MEHGADRSRAGRGSGCRSPVPSSGRRAKSGGGGGGGDARRCGVRTAWGVIRGGATRGPRQGDSLCDHRTPPPPSWSSCATPPPADARVSSDACSQVAMTDEGETPPVHAQEQNSKGYPKGASRQQEDHQVRVGGAKTVQHPRGGGAANGCLHLRGGSAVDRGRPSRNAKIESERWSRSVGDANPTFNFIPLVTGVGRALGHLIH